MDGPLDLEIGMAAAALAGQLTNGATWISAAATLGVLGDKMIKCHLGYYYQYGLMVDEETGWDIYGYTNY